LLRYICIFKNKGTLAGKLGLNEHFSLRSKPIQSSSKKHSAEKYGEFLSEAENFFNLPSAPKQTATKDVIGGFGHSSIHIDTEPVRKKLNFEDEDYQKSTGQHASGGFGQKTSALVIDAGHHDKGSSIHPQPVVTEAQNRNLDGWGTGNLRDSTDNVDIYKTNLKLKRYREISSLPDRFPIKDDMDGFNISDDYEYFEFERIARPTVMEGGKFIN
jgi:hypothetical protein